MCLSINFNLKLAVFNFKKIVNFIARFFFSFGIQIKNLHFSYVFFPHYVTIFRFRFSFVCWSLEFTPGTAVGLLSTIAD